MNISEKTYKKIINIFLILISITLIFRKPCSWIIAGFSIFSLIFIKKIKINKTSFKLMFFLAIPVLVELFFFYNNDNFNLGLKSLERSTSLILFPLFILGNYKYIDFLKLLRYYTIITTTIVFVFYIFFIYTNPMYLTKYSKGIDLWEIGYAFAGFVGIHAPALNMHLAFICICNFYFIIQFVQNKHYLQFIFNGIVFLVSLFLIIYVNTKLALFNAFFGFFIVILYELKNKLSTTKIIGIIGVLTIVFSIMIFLYLRTNPYMLTKYKEVTFAHMDKIGKLDELPNPEGQVYNSFVTRLTIWKSTWELSVKNLPFGVGASDAKPELLKYYEKTNQKFLLRNQLPVHNQYLNSLLRFGIFGTISVLFYILEIGYIGYLSKNVLAIAFFFLFFISNLTDDFLIRFDGITFSGFWASIFACFYMNSNIKIYSK